MICPHCRHADRLHSAPAPHRRAADGGPLAPDFRAGQCGQSARRPDGTWAPCACPGWHPKRPGRCTCRELPELGPDGCCRWCGGLVDPVRAAAWELARAAADHPVADLPFALTPPADKPRKGRQGGLF